MTSEMMFSMGFGITKKENATSEYITERVLINIQSIGITAIQLNLLEITLQVVKSLRNIGCLAAELKNEDETQKAIVVLVSVGVIAAKKSSEDKTKIIDEKFFENIEQQYHIEKLEQVIKQTKESLEDVMKITKERILSIKNGNSYSSQVYFH